MNISAIIIIRFNQLCRCRNKTSPMFKQIEIQKTEIKNLFSVHLLGIVIKFHMLANLLQFKQQKIKTQPSCPPYKHSTCIPR